MKLRGMKNQVWVTSAVTDDEAKKSIVLANSLKRVLSNRSVVVLASGKVAPNLRERLHYEFDHVFILEEDRNTARLKPEEFAKLSALTLKSFEKCIFVSPNMMFLKNADEIFDVYEDFPFASPDNDSSLSIFAYKPSLESYNVLMKALGSRNGTPVDKYIRNWFRNQYNQEPKHLEPRYNKKISLQKELCNPDKIDAVIVNFQNDPVLFPEANNAYLGLIDCHAIKIWNELYRSHVEGRPSSEVDLLTETSLTHSLEYSKEPIAIVGMSCRYPGSNNLEEFWQLLFNGEDGTGNPPPFRWLREQSSRNRPDCRKTNAGFLKVPVDEFDAKFFNISPKEVLFMDPQHRLMHELIWEGLEDAAIDPLKLRGSNGGVFMGSWTNDFKDILVTSGVTEFYRTYMGNSIGAAAARISFLLGLTGPSVATESGCSSAMVAVHLACRSLQLGETNLALACGVNLLLHPFDKDEMPMVISPEGRCKTFDSKADGFARGEGCGVLILKRFSDAIKDGDNIWALVRGSGVSQEGVSRSMGTPTVHCEALAMQQALKDAQVEPDQVAYVEAHGTGTVVGDPMEVAAIAKAYGKNRKEPLIIGSVKTNVGHTESCSGITGIMKVVLAMQHEMIPPHRNFETLNPTINLDAVPARIPLTPVEWKKLQGKPRIAGVSSFGITGTDAHAIIEEAPVIPLTDIKSTLERPQHILKISAKTDEALDILLEKYADNLEVSQSDLADIAYTANVGRANFNCRAVMVGKTRDEIVASIKKKAVMKQEVTEELGSICFLFTGQGSQYPGMAKNLYETSPVFRMHFDYCDTIMNDQYQISIKDVLWSENNKAEVSRTIYSQTSIFCVEYALLKLWESWGVKADYALGHSLGEFAAAVCAGILTPEDAIKLVAERSRLIDELPRGKMLVIKADKDTVATQMKKFAGNDLSKILDYAAVNSQQQTVVAGDSEVVLAFAQFCTDKNLKSIVLEATHAFHSKHMDPMLEKYREVAKTVKKGEEMNCTYISGMRGSVVEPEGVDAEYWVQHTRQKVDFLSASKTATSLGCQVFIEIGPQPVLSALTMMNNDGGNLLCLPSLKRTENEWDTILQTVGKLYLKGMTIDWEAFDQLYLRKKVRLPHYPFIGKKFWPDLLAVTGNTIHPLLGSLIPNASSTKLFQNGLNLRSLEYVKDHAIGKNVIFPGAGYLEMCLSAGHATVECASDSISKPSRPMKVENLSIEAPLCLEESKTAQVQIVVNFNNSSNDNKSDWNDLNIKIFHRLDSNSENVKWLSHAGASFTPLPSAEEKKVDFDLKIFNQLRELESSQEMITQVYDKLASVGLRFGPIFQSLENVWKNESGLLAKVKIPTGGDSQQNYIIHPVVLDAMIQAVMMQKVAGKIKKKLYVPISISKFIWLANAVGDELYIYCKETHDSAPNQAVLVDELGTVIAVMSGIELIDTTVKAVEAVLEQQTSAMPDLWEESWRSKMGPMQHRLPENIIFENICDPEFRAHIEKTYNSGAEDKEEIFIKLEEYVYYFILNCFYECGWSPKVGDSFNVDQVVKDLKIAEEHKKFTNYFLEVLEAEGVLKSSGKTWEVVSLPPTHDEVKAHLVLPVFTTELVRKFDPTRLITRVGESLLGIFRGTQSALQVLFPEDTKKNASVGAFYDEYGNAFNVTGSVADHQQHRIKCWQEKMAGDKKFVFRIVEVGAGTGVFTDKVLSVLSEMGVDFEYTYTDISAAFFSAAEKRFEKHAAHMKFKKLNIEEDPIAQGFTPDYYDYAIASDVIHATKDICNSLKNVRKLMRNGGNLDILEQTQKNRVITFVFGLMDGFWRFEDSEIRDDHCILTAQKWEKALEKSGFVNTLILPSFRNRHGLITTWATKDVTSSPNTIGMPSLPSWLIFSVPDCKLTEFISSQLKLADRRAICVRPGEQYQEVSREEFRVRGEVKEDFVNLMEALKTRKIPVEGILYLWGADKSRTQQAEILQPFFHIAQTVYSLKQKVTPRVCAVTQGIVPVGDNDLSHFHPSTLWGFVKSFRNENSDMNVRCISVSSDVNQLSETSLREVYHEIWSDDKEPQVAYAGGLRHIARFQPVKQVVQDLTLPSGTNRFQLILPDTKAIADLQFGPLDHLILEDNEVEIQIKASALNFRDVFSVIKPTEQFKDINTVGFDFAGVVRRTGSASSKWNVGDLVFGVNVHMSALPSHVRVDENDVLAVPPHMTLCQAATLPAVFATSYHCLIDVAKLKPTDIVLIHTASGGVGLSAVEIVKSVGCTIIATAGSKRKQNYLRSLGIQHIFNSRNTNYGDEILKVTNGHGVDVVLNALTSEGFKEATLKACAQGARFVEMSKLSIWKPEEVKALRPDVDYTIVDISSSKPEEWRRLMNTLQVYLEKRLVNPIPYVQFEGVNIREALRYLQSAKHIGKVVCVLPELRLEGGEYKQYTPMFNDRSTYLITGGLGGIGFEVAKWMVNKGAKNVLLASRRSPSTSTQAVITQLNSEGANVIPVKLDVGNFEECKKLIESIEDPKGMNLPQLRGIMHAAGTLSDGLIANQEWAKLSSTFNTKVNGTLNLHKLTKECALEHFVVFSSVSSLFGSPGQCNHAAGNNFEDTFTQYRHSMGLPATTVNWGQWGQVGVATEVDLPGMKALSTLQGISALEYVLKTQRLQTCVVNMESFVLFSKLSPQTAIYLDERIWKAGSSSTTSMTIKSEEFWQQYDSKQDRSEKIDMIKTQLKDILRNILKLDAEEAIDDEANFQEIGVDSLMYVEIKNAVQLLLGDRVTVSASALRDCNNVRLLSDQLMKLIEGDDSVQEEKPPTPEEVLAQLREDCQLSEHITAVGRPHKAISEIGTILVTGCTGTLGPYILKEISELPQIQEIYCLMRPSKTEPEERLKNILEFRDLLGSVNMSKIKYVEGNVSKPKLGMSDADWERVSQIADAVFHCAVKADHTQYYRKREGVEDVRAVNVQGTKNILEFACEGQVKHVFLASSLLSVAAADENDNTLSESWPKLEDFDGVTNLAYANSKFVGDYLMKQAVLERGVPGKIFRLPLISGDSKTGKFNVNSNHMMLRYFYIMKTGTMPSNPFPLVLLPVDLCASVSVHLFFREDVPESEIINITHHEPDIDQEFPRIAQELGFPVEFVEFSEFTEKLVNEPNDSSFGMFKEMYKNEGDLTAIYMMTSSVQKWLEGTENFWLSKKVSKYMPEYYSSLERTINTLERDLKFAQREGWFQKFGVVQSEK